MPSRLLRFLRSRRPLVKKYSQAKMQCLFPEAKREKFLVGEGRSRRFSEDESMTESCPEEPRMRRLRSPLEEEGEEDEGDKSFPRDLTTLVERQREHLPRALGELRRHGRKTSHWAWWAFPTEKSGYSEPEPKTYVTCATAPLLLSEAPDEWRQVLELVADLVSGDRSIHDVLPPIDHGRILFFIKFWRQQRCAPDWLKRVMETLETQLKCPTKTSYESGTNDDNSLYPKKQQLRMRLSKSQPQIADFDASNGEEERKKKASAGDNATTLKNGSYFNSYEPKNRW